MNGFGSTSQLSERSNSAFASRSRKSVDDTIAGLWQTLEQAVSGAWTGERLPAPLQAALPKVLAAKVARLRLVRQFSAAFLGRLLDGAAPGAWAILRESAEAPDRVRHGLSSGSVPEFP